MNKCQLLKNNAGDYLQRSISKTKSKSEIETSVIYYSERLVLGVLIP